MKTVLGILSEIRPEFDFTENRDFIKEGMLDSFDIIALVSSLEQEFSIRIDGTDIVPENFASLDAIEKLVRRSSKKA